MKRIIMRSIAALGLSCLGAIAAAAPFSVGTFMPWQGYAIPNGQWLTGDFNGDRRTDIVHLVQGTDYVHTWTSNGTGGFSVGTFRPWAGYAIPNGVWVTGDFNGDGRTDLLHVVANTDYAHVWRSNGNGSFNVSTFRPWAGYAMPNGQWLAADINGDGRTDIVHVVQGADYVHTWTSNGNGTFSVGTFRPWAGYAMPNGQWLVADINGDRRADLVHVVQGTDYVHTWTSNGNGTFGVGTFRPWAGYAMPNGEWMVADIDGNGRADLIHAVKGADYVHTWRSNGNGTFAVGTFRPWAGYAIPNGVWRVGDFNGDGKADIVHAVQGTDYAHVWLGDGNGGFNVLTFSPWAGYAIPNGLWLTGDFNADGRTDIVHAVQNTSYVHPWLSTLPKPGEVAIDGIEVTQAIQEMGHSVPLVADKATLARVYLNVNGPAAMLTGVLQARRGGGAWVNLAPLASANVQPAENFVLRPKREDLAKSLNFRVPATLDGAGSLQLRMASVSNAGGGGARVCSDCASTSRSVAFQAVGPMRLRVLGLSYATGTPPTTFAPRALDFALVGSWLRRAYPIATLNMTSATIAANNPWPFGCGQANARAAGVRATDVANGTDARTHYYALVHDGGGFMRGCTAAIPNTPAPATVASGPTGAGTFGWDTDGSYGDWYTGHELGHTYGRLHPGSGCGDSADDPNEPFTGGQISGNDGAWVGLDIGDVANGIPMAALPGVPWHDVMTYCERQWLSHYTYNGIRARLAGEDALPGGMPAPSDDGVAAAAGPAPMAAAPAQKPMPAQARPAAVVSGQPRTLGDISTGGEAPALAALAAGAEPLAALPVAYAAAAVPEPALARPPTVLRGEAPRSGDAAGQAAGAAPRAAAVSAGGETVRVQTGDLASVVATVNFTRQTAKLESIARVRRGIAGAVPADGEAAVRFLNAQGRVIASHPVALRRDTDIPPNEDQTGLIDAVVPVAPGAARIEVLIGDKVMDSRDISLRAPQLSLSRGAAVAGAGAGNEGVLNWSAKHPDDRPLSFSVLVSADGGKSWQTVADGLRESSYVLKPDDFSGKESVRVRVIANDGFNTTTVTESRAVAKPAGLR